MMVYESQSAQETVSIAKAFAKDLAKGDVVAFFGELGAGKTSFVKGIADYFEANGEVSSPTFTLVNQYDGAETLYHFDAYRLENVTEENCDWLDDYFFGDGICLVEWAENIAGVLPRGYISVRIEKANDKGESYRKISISRQGE